MPVVSARSRQVALAIAGACLLGGAQCDNLIPAVGGSGSVTLVTHLPAGHPAETALRATLEREVVLVHAEPAFRVETARSSEVGKLRHARNLVLMADLSTGAPLVGEIEKLVGERVLSELRTGGRPHVFYSDVWAKGQTLLVVAAADDERLTKAIESNADALFESFERRVISQTIQVLYLGGEQTEFSRYLEQRYGWTLRIPKGYRISEDEETRVVRFLMTEGGVRLVFVHWRDGVTRLPAPDTLFDLRESIVRAYDEDRILRDHARWERADFLGRRVIKLDGVWQNDRHTKGGPFRTYCFLQDSRLYMIDLLVFNPDGSKIDLMRQVESMARTFREPDPG